VPFLKLSGIVAGGWQMARAALVARRKLSRDDAGDADFYRAKIITSRHFAEHVLTQAGGLSLSIRHGAASTMRLDNDQF
jgi:hypothetical protein